MKKILCVLLAASVFSGCFDIYIYLIPLKDNSYIISERVSFGLEVLTMINSLSSMDSSGQSTQKVTPTPKQMMDSILAGESKKDNDFEKLPGYLTHSMRDSLFDTTAFFITDVHVKSADDIPDFINATQSDKNSPPDILINLKVSHPKGVTKFDFAAIKNKKPADNNSNIIDMAKLETGGFHIGVLSENLQPPNTKAALKSIPGGNEWFIPFNSLKNLDKVKMKKVQFVVRN
ncbi:MAG: hypothetical protein ACHQM6_10655 [Candidatus Kapaibacterium sp.]